MKKELLMKLSSILIGAVFVFFTGCGKQPEPVKVSRKTNMALPKFGFSIDIPKGWKSDNAQLCHRGNNTGLVMAEPIVDNDYDKTVFQLSEEFSSDLIYEEDFKIAGHKVTISHLKTSAGVYCFRAYVLSGKHVILVSYSLESKEAFNRYKNSIRKTINTMKLNN